MQKNKYTIHIIIKAINSMIFNSFKSNESISTSKTLTEYNLHRSMGD